VQVEGVRFMFHNLVQSAEALKAEAEASGTRAGAKFKFATKPDTVGGCVLAHCMGLVSVPLCMTRIACVSSIQRGACVHV
jgi:hypothetical protein